jgi:predicted RNA-binding Zn-ribbon protein involved in translation (DUF1610 family)
MNKKNYKKDIQKVRKDSFLIPTQNCPLCGEKISALPGSRDAVCKNCGFKDPCCE